MKQFLLFLIPLLFTQCTLNNEKETDEFDYLLGSWTRTNDVAEKSTHEIWKKDTPGFYLGLGYTLQDKDTVFKEEMLIIKKGKEWLFAVNGVNESVTPFTIISHEERSFICENEENEFPKRIKYELINDSLIASISDDTNEILFVFKRD